MKKLLTPALAFVALVSISWASINLNSSRSNSYRVIYAAPTVMIKAQAEAVLEQLDKIGRADEATVKKWLQKNLKLHGVHTENIKEVLFVPAAKTKNNLITIVLLTNAADEREALKGICAECELVRNSASKPN
jgi:hypothetical protein